MKIIKINDCDMCPYNDKRRLNFGGWDDYCIKLNKIVNPNTIDSDCKLDEIIKEK